MGRFKEAFVDEFMGESHHTEVEHFKFGFHSLLEHGFGEFTDVIGAIDACRRREVQRRESQAGHVGADIFFEKQNGTALCNCLAMPSAGRSDHYDVSSRFVMAQSGE